MALQRFTRFVISYTLVGIVVAIAVVWLAPELLERQRPVVRVDESPRTEPDALRPPNQPFTYADAVEAAAPSVVNIYTATRTPDPRNAFLEAPALDDLFGGLAPTEHPDLDTSLGSGVLISDAGHLLTNHHVIRGAARIQVMLADGRTAPASLVGTDPESDLAVLQVEGDDLPHITLAHSAGSRVGDVVFAIGNPFGVGQTVTQGIVSAVGRSELGLTTFENFIQTDAAINPGNSGGALVNARGEVIGINTAIFSQSGGSMGIGFAIPADLARAVFTDIIENGRVIRGWIGLQVIPQQDAPGVRVAGILPGGPADNAGLKAGDTIQSVDGQPIRTVRDLLNRITERRPETRIVLRGAREGEARDWPVRVAERPTDLGGDAPQQPPAR
ncbi:S1C family serine protease [Spiribacter onubensis]|uniref:Trypsin-like peptidase domain-containing protein n=1 Tax=Spiribacter onubensis TaxID=3122420 RepID=A0ABV3S5V8_9GAMM